MNTRFTAAASVLVISLASCDLHQDPVGLLTPGQISTDPTLNSVKVSVTSSYQMLASTLNLLGEWRWDLGIVFRNDFIVDDIASDDVKKKWNPDGDQAWMDQVQSFNFTASNQAFNGQWSYDYEGISRTNLAISYLTDAAITAKIGIDPALKDRLLGEVYFLRAFYYFDLVNNFGAVPLVLKPLSSFDEAYRVAKRETPDKVYAQVSADLAQAKTLLPNSKYSDPVEPWRASKGAVLALQAKVALYNQRWTDVISIVTELEGLNFYSLNANYFDSFDVTKEATETEVIFDYDHQSLQTPRKGNGLCAPLDWGFIAPTDNYPQAIAIINTIRNRARTSVTVTGALPPPGTLPDRSVASVDKNEIMGWLMHERRVELGFESQRFNDLKRWAIAKPVLSALGKNFQEFNYLYPIPQGEIDKSGGTITQNPGY